MDYPINSDYQTFIEQKRQLQLPMTAQERAQGRKGGNYLDDMRYLNVNGLKRSNNIQQTCDDKHSLVCYVAVNDARTFEGARGMMTVLDKPSFEGYPSNVESFNNVHNIDNSHYGGVYNSYKDIQNGQISYYIDNSIAQPFFAPVYVLNSIVDKSTLVDPTGNHRPQYNKIPITNSLNYLNVDQKTKDDMSFREDLMSKQQSKNNQSKWTARFVN